MSDERTPAREAAAALTPRVLLAAAAVLLLACAPEIAGFLAHGRDFLGVPDKLDLLDNLVYIERAGQAPAGLTSFPNLHTSEAGAINPQVVPLPWTIGWLLRACGIRATLYPFVSKLVIGAVTLVFLALLAARLFSPADRPVGLAHLWLAGGLFWTLDFNWMARGGTTIEYQNLLAVLQPDSSNFFALYFHAHVALALVLLVGCLWTIFLARRPRPFAAAALGAGIAVLHTYDLVPLAAVCALHLAYLRARNPGRFRACLPAVVAALAAAVPPALLQFRNSYLGVHGFQMDDYWLGASNYLFGYGQPLLFGVYYLISEAGWRAESHEDATDTPLWVAWLVAAPWMLVNPYLFFRRKLALGLSVPVAVLGARGVVLFCRSVLPDKPRPQRALAAVLTLAACLSSFDVPLRDAAGAVRGEFPMVLSSEIRAVLERLARDATSGGVVLAQPDYVSQLIPALAGRRVFRGWSIYLRDPVRRAAELKEFLAPGTSASERAAFLERHGITDVVLTEPQCKEIGADRLSFLQRVAQHADLVVFRVRLATPVR
ncbi:MAG: hypothetical protein HY303_05200 [Candidatus Wallbacteria bacterium]|nr:hypothetical protein [Candidatus Wallbacteria bacterium]